jgi:hypothetical protein
VKYKIAAYKVIDKDGQYAGPGMRFSSTGKTWGSKAQLNGVFTWWKKGREGLNPETGKYWDTPNPGPNPYPYKRFDHPLPEDWTVLVLTEDGLEKIPARIFYGK